MKRSRKIQQARFAALADGLAADLFRYGLWLCGDPAVAEDLVQETLMRAWRSFGRLKNGASAKAWLFILLRREHARLTEGNASQPGPLDAARMAEAERHDTTAEAGILRRALAELEPIYREPLVLQVLAGLSCAEIAELLELSHATVTTRVFRARKQLRDALTEQTLESPTNKVKV